MPPPQPPQITTKPIQQIIYYLSQHPSITNFRWNSTYSYGSTWAFLVTSITSYILISFLLHLLLILLPRRRPIPLGPLPAVHSLTMSLLSLTIFTGIFLSATAEIHETRFLSRRFNKTPLQWLLCFPLGTRPSGRVFFWSYVFYLSRFVHLFRTFFYLLRYRKLPLYHLFNHSILIFSSFLWLEFSQSFQVLVIVFTSFVTSVVYGYRFWVYVGLPSACFPFVLNCQIVVLGFNLVCHIGVVIMHFFIKGGCNGIGAWGFNSVLNVALLSLFLNFYVKRYLRKSKVKYKINNHGGDGGGGGGSESERVKDA